MFLVKLRFIEAKAPWQQQNKPVIMACLSPNIVVFPACKLVCVILQVLSKH